jgi:DNA-binding NtrC family response regulator
MANLQSQRKEGLDSEKLDSLRNTVRSLLKEMNEGLSPVRIDPANGVDFYQAVARFEAQLIESALEATGGRQNRAARLLNLRNSTLSTKIKQLRIRQELV